MIELSVALVTPRHWQFYFGWTSHELEDNRAFKSADVLTIAFLFFKARLWVFYNANDDDE